MLYVGCNRCYISLFVDRFKVNPNHTTVSCMYLCTGIRVRVYRYTRANIPLHTCIFKEQYNSMISLAAERLDDILRCVDVCSNTNSLYFEIGKTIS